MFSSLNHDMKTTLSCPYCIGWFQGKTKPHALMSNLKPICGTKTKLIKHINEQLNKKVALNRLKIHNGCIRCIKKLGDCYANP